MSEETRITANPLPTETHVTSNQPSKVETRICIKDGCCPKCGSVDVIPNVYVLDYPATHSTGNVQVVVLQNPDAWFNKGEVSTSLKAWVCGACGYTELYAKNPAALLAAYRNRAEQG